MAAIKSKTPTGVQHPALKNVASQAPLKEKKGLEEAVIAALRTRARAVGQAWANAAHRTRSPALAVPFVVRPHVSFPSKAQLALAEALSVDIGCCVPGCCYQRLTDLTERRVRLCSAHIHMPALTYDKRTGQWKGIERCCTNNKCDKPEAQAVDYKSAAATSHGPIEFWGSASTFAKAFTSGQQFHFDQLWREELRAWDAVVCAVAARVLGSAAGVADLPNVAELQAELQAELSVPREQHLRTMRAFVHEASKLTPTKRAQRAKRAASASMDSTATAAASESPSSSPMDLDNLPDNCAQSAGPMLIPGGNSDVSQATSGAVPLPLPLAPLPSHSSPPALPALPPQPLLPAPLIQSPAAAAAADDEDAWWLDALTLPSSPSHALAPLPPPTHMEPPPLEDLLLLEHSLASVAINALYANAVGGDLLLFML